MAWLSNLWISFLFYQLTLNYNVFVSTIQNVAPNPQKNPTKILALVQQSTIFQTPLNINYSVFGNKIGNTTGTYCNL